MIPDPLHFEVLTQMERLPSEDEAAALRTYELVDEAFDLRDPGPLMEALEYVLAAWPVEGIQLKTHLKILIREYGGGWLDD